MTNPDFEIWPIEATYRFTTALGHATYQHWDVESPIRNPIEPDKFNYVSAAGASSALSAILACKRAQLRLLNETKILYQILLSVYSTKMDITHYDDDQIMELILYCITEGS